MKFAGVVVVAWNKLKKCVKGEGETENFLWDWRREGIIDSSTQADMFVTSRLWLLGVLPSGAPSSLCSGVWKLRSVSRLKNGHTCKYGKWTFRQYSFVRVRPAHSRGRGPVIEGVVPSYFYLFLFVACRPRLDVRTIVEIRIFTGVKWRARRRRETLVAPVRLFSYESDKRKVPHSMYKTWPRDSAGVALLIL